MRGLTTGKFLVKMSEIKPEETAAAKDNNEDQDWAAAKAVFDSLKTKVPRPVSRTCRSLQPFWRRRSPENSLQLFLPAAQTPVRRHHRGVLSHPFQHGGREEDLRGRRSGEVCGLSGGARKRASESRTGFSFRQGTGESRREGKVWFMS